MKTNHCMTTLFALVISVVCATAQQITTENLLVKDGISSNYVRDIAQDKSGFLWMATDYGLNRFDGKNIKTFLKEENNTQQQINSNDICKIAVDTLRNWVWIANYREGINVFDCLTEEIRSFVHQTGNDASLVSNIINDIQMAADGSVWIATDKGVDQYLPDTQEFIHYNSHTVPHFPTGRVKCIAVGDDGLLYIGFIHNGFSLFNPTDRTIKNYTHADNDRNSLPHNIVHDIYVETPSRIWMATDAGVSLFNPFKEQFINTKDLKEIHPSMRQSVWSIYKSSDGQFWIGTSSDLCYFHAHEADAILAGQQDVRHTFIRDLLYGIQNPSVYCTFEDSFHNIWIGSNGAGCSFISSKPSRFHHWRIELIPGVTNGLNDKEIQTICIDRHNNIWMGTDGGGINVNVQGANRIRYMPQSDLPILCNAYQTSLVDSNGDIWFGCYNGINIYRSGQARWEIIRSCLPTSLVKALYEDSRHRVWIASDNGIETYRLSDGKQEVIDVGEEHPATHTCKCFVESTDKTIWMGTEYQGIYRYNPDSRQMEQIDHPQLATSTVHQLFKDSKNRIWAATSDGLFLMTGEFPCQITRYSVKDGMASNAIKAIAEDYWGNIWISTQVGISSFVEEGQRFNNYDYRDGALYGNYMPHSVARAADGTIYFGSINGVCYFNPADMTSPIQLPPVRFTDFSVHSKKLEQKDTHIPIGKQDIALSYQEDIFTVSFNILDKSLQDRVEYAYQMEGLNNEWINIGTQNQVSFRNIPFKTYKLHVKARYHNQQWQPAYSTLTIRIIPPFWLTIWAKLTYILAFVGILIAIFRSYKRRLILQSTLALEKEKTKKQQELNEERLIFYTNITHELRTPLTLILGPLEDLESDPDIQEKHHKKISLIHKSTIRLLNLVTQILEFRKTETQNKRLCVREEDMAAVIQEIGMRYVEISKKKGIAYHVRIETESTTVLLDKEVIRMIADNLLSNAFKYTHEGSISLTLRTRTIDQIEYTEFEVADTGIGIEESALSHIFERYYRSSPRQTASGVGIGLALVKNLVQLHEGIIEVKSQPGIGSQFCVRLVTHNNYPNAIHITQSPKEMDDPHINRCIILLVEDDVDIRNYMAEALMESYEVVVADDGEQAFQKAQEVIPDVIISDVMMPVMDGIRLCKLVKSTLSTSHIPVILLTAKDSLQDKEAGYDAGADSYVTKPFSVSLLKSRISNLLAARKKMASQLQTTMPLKRSIMLASHDKANQEFLGRLTTLIEQQLADEKIDMTTVAQHFSMSYSSLYRKVKAITGTSAGEFVRKVRIQKAEQLLLSGQYNISEITHLVGLNSVSHFRECFKEEYGLSPSEYLRKLKENGSIQDNLSSESDK